jgi:hypothetical protein
VAARASPAAPMLTFQRVTAKFADLEQRDVDLPRAALVAARREPGLFARSVRRETLRLREDLTYRRGRR